MSPSMKAQLQRQKERIASKRPTAQAIRITAGLARIKRRLTVKPCAEVSSSRSQPRGLAQFQLLARSNPAAMQTLMNRVIGRAGLAVTDR